MQNHQAFKIAFPKKSMLRFFLGFILLSFYSSCGTSDTENPGKCKPVSGGAKYVASTNETDGKRWTFEMTPADVQVECYNSGTINGAVITGRILDGLGLAKGGLAVTAIGAGGGFELLSESETVTDSCGMVRFYLRYTCPEASGQKAGGSFYATSGSLTSTPVKIDISRAAVVTTTPAP